MNINIFFKTILIIAIILFSSPSTEGQTKRTAKVRIENKTGKLINTVMVIHKYSNNYKNKYTWNFVKNGSKTPYDMKATYNTGAFTTGRDWWFVTWTYEKKNDEKYFYQRYTDPNNFRGFIDGLEKVSVFGFPIASAGIAAFVCPPSTALVTAIVAIGGLEIGAMLSQKLFNFESTKGFKQHILRKEDSGKKTTIIINKNGTVKFKSKSGVSETVSTRKKIKINYKRINKIIKENKLFKENKATEEQIVQLMNLGSSPYKGYYLNVGQKGKVSMTKRKSASGTYWEILKASNGSIQFKNRGNSPYKGYYLDVDQKGKVSMTKRKSASGTYWGILKASNGGIQFKNRGNIHIKVII